MSTETINERIKYLIKERYNGSQRAFSYATAISPAVINSIVGKRQTAPSFEALQKISTNANISAEWLLHGNGAVEAGTENKLISSPIPGKGVPLIPVDAMAGAFRGAIEIRDDDLQWYIVPSFDGADFLITIKGDSMFPKYQSGDLIACKKVPMQDIFFQWGKAYVVDTDQGVLVKNVRPGTERDHITLESVNPAYLPFQLPLEGIYNVAIVLGVIRSE